LFVVYFILKEDIIMLYLSEEGQGLIEYGLVLALIAVVIILVLVLIGPQVGNLYSQVVPCIGFADVLPHWCLE
jgi:pilus assembly protein Flp/PilA